MGMIIDDDGVMHKVFTKDEVITMFTDLKQEIEECVDGAEGSPEFEQSVSKVRVQVVEMIQDKINALKEAT